jgi:HSP20 family protein
MALAVRSMWDPFGSLVRQLEADFARPHTFVPSADVVRDGGDVVVTLELPGIDVEKDVDVEVSDGRLLVSGTRQEEKSTEENGVIIRESRSGAFRREFALPEHVTAEHVEADYDRGLLRIRVHDVAKPKAEPKKITVRR